MVAMFRMCVEDIASDITRTGIVGGLHDIIMREWFGAPSRDSGGPVYNPVGRHVQKERMPSRSANARRQSCLVWCIRSGPQEASADQTTERVDN